MTRICCGAHARDLTMAEIRNLKAMPETMHERLFCL